MQTIKRYILIILLFIIINFVGQVIMLLIIQRLNLSISLDRSIGIGFVASTIFFILLILLQKNEEHKRLNIQAIKNLLLILFFSVVGVIAGYKIGGYIVDLQTSGAFVSWELLDGPYKFTEIVNANSSTVWAKTANGKLYTWKNCQHQDNCKWIEVENVPSDAHEDEMPLNKGVTCPSNGFSSLPKNLPGKVIECALGWYVGIDAGFGSYFVLLEDGTIWSWRHTQDIIGASMTIIPLSVCIGFIASPVLFIAIMIIVGKFSNREIE